MFGWYKMAFEKYADFSTRSTRNEFWWFFLCNLIVMFAIAHMGGRFEGMFRSPAVGNLFSGVLSLYYLASLIPSFAVMVRRLHDTNRSGWSILFSLIPLIGGIILIVFLAQPSDLESNKWGPVPGEEDELEDALIDFEDDLV